MTQPEPWLRGTLSELHPVTAHLLYTFEQAREELTHFCSGLAVEDVWKAPHERIASLGFQLRHIAGSIDRLTTYLLGEQLDERQLGALKREHEPGADFQELMAALEIEFRRTEAVVRAIAPASFEDARAVGRRQLPTSAGGLIIHISEHTQRHLGQAVLTAKLLRRVQ
jgi:uncharacterized damage-inducible protein DinB